MSKDKSRIALLALAKNLSNFYVINNNRLFLSKSKINEYLVFMTETLNSYLNLDEKVITDAVYSSFDDELNPNYQSDCELLKELFMQDCIVENVDSFNKKSIDNLVANLSKSLFQSNKDRVSLYTKSLLQDCITDNFDIEDEDQILEVCNRVAERLYDYQLEE